MLRAHYHYIFRYREINNHIFAYYNKFFKFINMSVAKINLNAAQRKSEIDALS